MRPLDGISVIEMAGLAPSPYCGMILADFGADVVIVDRLSTGAPEIPNIMAKNPFDRGKRSVRINLKAEEGMAVVRKMVQASDVLLEPYRPGVMEKLGLGPNEAMALNPKLIYARLTGWGQNGPYASMAGHDINYIALSGALSLFRRKGEKPLPPCNLLGDFAGGGMLCAMGILLALIERTNSGKGQVVDAAMVDGATNISTLFWGLLANQLMTLDIGTNMLDSGAPYYQTYETADGKFMSVGAAKVFKTKTRDEWTAIFDGTDACVAPILDMDEVDKHRHNRERGLLLEVEGASQPAPAPRLSRTPGSVQRPGTPRGSETREILEELEYKGKQIEELFAKNVIE
jgi:alpha-methylacyl-CoA racemase